MPEAVLSSEPGACVHLSEVVDQSPRGRGQLRTVRVLAMLPGEPPEAARTVFAVSGRPREELWQIVRRWLDANRVRLPEILARGLAQRQQELALSEVDHGQEGQHRT